MKRLMRVQEAIKAVRSVAEGGPQSVPTPVGDKRDNVYNIKK